MENYDSFIERLMEDDGRWVQEDTLEEKTKMVQ
jgi:hypothetical protein